MAFHDIAPQAPVHILLIPKKEIKSLAHITESDQALMGYLMVKASQIAKNQSLENGYRVVMNIGKDGGQTVDHLHFHILGKRVMKETMG